MLPSHKEGVLYLEHCRLVVSDDRLSFVREANAVEKYWSIPYAATGCILMGPGTSLTQQAAKFLASEGVMAGFVGGGGSPLYFASQNEYRPTRHMQEWCSFWFDESRRLRVAHHLLACRADFVLTCYDKVVADLDPITAIANDLKERCAAASNTEQLLGIEAVFAKRLYKFWATKTEQHFRRAPRSADTCNRFLDHGNYLAYGLAASALWVLGISHAFPVLHGETRRGALVFDIADVIKDACILPAVFLGAAESDNDSENRQRCIASLDRFHALSKLFSTIKSAIDVGCSG